MTTLAWLSSHVPLGTSSNGLVPATGVMCLDDMPFGVSNAVDDSLDTLLRYIELIGNRGVGELPRFCQMMTAQLRQGADLIHVIVSEFASVVNQVSKYLCIVLAA